jgi:hypothetical protein
MAIDVRTDAVHLGQRRVSAKGRPAVSSPSILPIHIGAARWGSVSQSSLSPCGGESRPRFSQIELTFGRVDRSVFGGSTTLYASDSMMRLCWRPEATRPQL